VIIFLLLLSDALAYGGVSIFIYALWTSVYPTLGAYFFARKAASFLFEKNKLTKGKYLSALIISGILLSIIGIAPLFLEGALQMMLYGR
jgi:hypothetical protein